MTKYFGVPFAISGDKTIIPDVSQPDGTVNFTDGYTPDYEADQTVDPDAKDVPRQSENYFKFVVTEALKELQEYGFKVYDTLVDYPAGAITKGSDNNTYEARVANGPGSTTVDPVGDVTRTWIKLFDDTVDPKKFGAIGDNTTDDYTAVSNAHAFCVANNKSLKFTNGTYKISTNLTLSVNVIFDENAILSPDNSITVSIDGPLQAGRYEIFTGDGVVDFMGNSQVSVFYAEWFGIKTSNTGAQNDAKILKMGNGSNDYGAPTGVTIKWGIGDYNFDTSYVWPTKRWIWEGSSGIETTLATRSTRFVSASGSAGSAIDFGTGVNTSRFSKLKNMTVTNSGTGTAVYMANLGAHIENCYLEGGGKGLHIDSATDIQIKDTYCKGDAQGLYIAPSGSNSVTACLFSNVVCVCDTGIGDALSLTDTVQSGSIVGNTFLNVTAQTANRGIAIVGTGAIRNTFIDCWTESITGTTPKQLEDTNTSNSIFINPSWRDSKATAPVNYGTTTSYFESSAWTMASPLGIPVYTVSSVPGASLWPDTMVIISDETGGRTIATSDGTNWRRVSDGAIIS